MIMQVVLNVRMDIIYLIIMFVKNVAKDVNNVQAVILVIRAFNMVTIYLTIISVKNV